MTKLMDGEKRRPTTSVSERCICAHAVDRQWMDMTHDSLHKFLQSSEKVRAMRMKNGSFVGSFSVVLGF